MDAAWWLEGTLRSFSHEAFLFLLCTRFPRLTAAADAAFDWFCVGACPAREVFLVEEGRREGAQEIRLQQSSIALGALCKEQ